MVASESVSSRIAACSVSTPLGPARGLEVDPAVLHAHRLAAAAQPHPGLHLEHGPRAHREQGAVAVEQDLGRALLGRADVVALVEDVARAGAAEAAGLAAAVLDLTLDVDEPRLAAPPRVLHRVEHVEQQTAADLGLVERVAVRTLLPGVLRPPRGSTVARARYSRWPAAASWEWRVSSRLRAPLSVSVARLSSVYSSHSR